MTRSAPLLLLVLAISCSSDTEAPRKASEVPVFIVSIDSVRADRLPAYGYARGSTPAIDAFRRDAVLYQYAFANAPLTLPSHASILTGELPPVHGIRGDVGYRLSPDAGTLATALRQLGYSTGAAVSSYVLRRETGVGEGFDFYDDRVGSAPRPTLSERAGDDTRLALTTWLEATPGHRVFGFLHLNRPHAPHVATGGGGAEPAVEYDGEISHADGVFGRFIETLRERDLYDASLIVLLSDHGEGLGDHGEEEHGLFVYRESIHVPLLVKLPRSERRGETVVRAVGLNHVRDLVLDVIRGQRQAVLLRKAGPVVPVYSETYYPRIHFGWRELRSLITDTRHFIDSRTPELYDYRADPAESKNLARAEPDVVRAMTRTVRMADTGFRPPTERGPDDGAQLASLRAAERAASETERPDPKEKVQIVRDLQRAVRFYEARRHRDAIPLLERVVFSEPAIVDGWALLGQSRAAAGQPSLALEAYREGLRRFPNNPELSLLAAREYAKARNWEAATQLAQSIANDDPVLAHEAIAGFAIGRGDLAAAREHAEIAIRHAPGRVPTLLLLADLARRSGRPADQLMWLDRAAQEVSSRSESSRQGLHAGRGQALAALGRVGEAEAAYRDEVSQHPANLTAWKELALVVGSTGRRDEARQILLAAIRANDTAEMRQLAREALVKLGDADGMKFIEARLARK